jgi:hypothetical protein
MQKVHHGYEGSNDTTWHSKDYEGVATVRLTFAVSSREMLCYCTEDGLHKLTSARRVYGNIAAGSKILSNPEIMGSSDNVMMWSRCVRRSSSSDG